MKKIYVNHLPDECDARNLKLQINCSFFLSEKLYIYIYNVGKI